MICLVSYNVCEFLHQQFEGGIVEVAADHVEEEEVRCWQLHQDLVDGILKAHLHQVLAMLVLKLLPIEQRR